VYGVGTSATTSGNNVMVDFRVSFAAGFEGEKQITMEGADESGTFTFSNLSFGTYTVTTRSPTAAPSFTLSNTAVSIASPGANGISTITVTPTGGFSGTVAFSCAVTDSPSGAVDTPTCLPAAPAAISGAAAVTASLTINTTAASAAALHNPLEQIFTLGGGVGMGAMLFFGLPIRRRRWKTLLCLLLIAEFAGTAIGCGGTAYSTAAPANPGTADPGTTAGSYTVKVTGTSGATMANTL
jgi:trimeric autotransporter adhesin